MEGEPRHFRVRNPALTSSQRARGIAASSPSRAAFTGIKGGHREVAALGKFPGVAYTYAIRRVIWPAARTLERRRALDVMSRCPKSPKEVSRAIFIPVRENEQTTGAPTANGHVTASAAIVSDSLPAHVVTFGSSSRGNPGQRPIRRSPPGRRRRRRFSEPTCRHGISPRSRCWFPRDRGCSPTATGKRDEWNFTRPVIISLSSFHSPRSFLLAATFHLPRVESVERRYLGVWYVQ